MCHVHVTSVMACHKVERVVVGACERHVAAWFEVVTVGKMCGCMFEGQKLCISGVLMVLFSGKVERHCNFTLFSHFRGHDSGKGGHAEVPMGLNI